jgi:tetratricopeptide (TPR) repeat protein
MTQRAQPAPPPLTEAVRAIYLERRSGVVEVASDGAEEADAAKRRLFFVDGELHLPKVHALAKKLAPHLPLWPDRPSRGGAPSPSAWMSGAKSEVKDLMVRIARLVAGWQRASYTFFEGPQTLPPDLVGPLPTVFLLMEWAVADRSDVELLADLGGPGVQLVTTGGAISPAVAAVLEPQESVLLSRLGESATVGELLRQAGGDGTAVLRRLGRLRAVGLIRYRREPDVLQRGALVPADILLRLSDRLERELTLRPFDLAPDAHRAQLADLLARAGGLTHYELLGVGEEASADEVYEAYERLARLVHPSHSEHLELTGREAALWLLFERATDAYLTLSSPDRRRRYEAKVGGGHDPAPSQEVREREAERLARGYYQRALTLLDEQDYHFAVELLRQAVQTHPQAEYYLRLAEALAKNPNWLRQAADAYRKALELGGDDPRVRVALAQTLEAMGHLPEARRHYESALARMPADPEALAGIARVADQLRPEAKKRGGFLSLFRRG